eukprot:Sspe_Gene.22646::Locus_8638_Transcript_3_4_Confidence_0.400_Length_1777::g.22646::m.22646
MIRDQKTRGADHDERPQAPRAHHADNAGVEGAVVVGKLLEANKEGFGYDAQNDKYVNMFDAGIIDPTKVVRCWRRGRRVRGLAADHHGDRHRRQAEGGVRRHGWHGRHGWDGRNGR